MSPKVKDWLSWLIVPCAVLLYSISTIAEDRGYFLIGNLMTLLMPALIMVGIILKVGWSLFWKRTLFLWKNLIFYGWPAVIVLGILCWLYQPALHFGVLIYLMILSVLMLTLLYQGYMYIKKSV